MGTHGLVKLAGGQTGVAAHAIGKGVLGPFAQPCQGAVFGIAGKAFVHPAIQVFVGAQHHLVPTVAPLVHGRAKACGVHEGAHGVLGGATTGVYETVLRVGIGAVSSF